MTINFHFVLLICTILFLGSCQKRIADPDNNTNNYKDLAPGRTINHSRFYYVEKFRKNGMTDTEVIQAALDSIPENSTLKFGDKEYIIEHTLYLYKSVHLTGPATLKREDQFIYKLIKPAMVNDRQLILNSTKGLKIRDYFFLTNGGKSHLDNSSLNLITNIKGDTVTLYYPNPQLLNGASDFPVGTYFIKDVKFFWIMDKDVNVFPTQSCKFSRLTFDGNREENDASYSWLIHTAVMAQTLGPTTFDYCSFINSPSETIMGHNCIIRNCTFKDLNGSAFHTSMDREKVPEDKIHSLLENNHFENTNEISTYIGGHSEGCITHSNSGGYYTATGNTFIDVGFAVIATLYPSVSPHDWGTSNILFTDNTINTAGRLVRALATHIPGEVKNVRIINNKIEEVTTVDWSASLENWPDVIIENEINQ